MKILTVTFGVAVGISCLVAGCAMFSGGNAGKEEFDMNCATCHGVDAKGDGPQASNLPTRPANLTLLAKKNGGVFPAQRITQLIDGQTVVAAHGSREMPVWGVDLQIVPESAPQELSDEPFGMRDATVRARIKAIVDYLSTLQEK